MPEIHNLQKWFIALFHQLLSLSYNHAQFHFNEKHFFILVNVEFLGVGVSPWVKSVKWSKFCGQIIYMDCKKGLIPYLDHKDLYLISQRFKPTHQNGNFPMNNECWRWIEVTYLYQITFCFNVRMYCKSFLLV